MTDREITEMFFSRNEAALEACRRQYGASCRAVAGRVLSSPRDVEEAVSDAYFAAWQSIPPHRPESLVSYLCMLARRCAIDILKRSTRQKRGGGAYEEVLDELGDCIPSRETTEEAFDRKLLRDSLDRFLDGLPERSRVIFMKRYWWLLSVKEIAKELGMNESAVKMQLMRTREKLKDHLEKEGFSI